MAWGDYDSHEYPRRGQPIFSKKYFKLLKLCNGQFVLQPVFLGWEYLPERAPYVSRMPASLRDRRRG